MKFCLFPHSSLLKYVVTMLKVLLLLQQLWLTSDTDPWAKQHMHFLAIFCFLDSWVSSKSICSHWRSSKGLRRASGRVTCTGLSIYIQHHGSNSEYINLHLTSCGRGHWFRHFLELKEVICEQASCLYFALIILVDMLFSTSFSLFLSLLVSTLDKSTEKKHHQTTLEDIGVPDYTFPN